MDYMLLHNNEPLYVHDCDNCEWLGSVEIYQNAAQFDLYACIRDTPRGVRGSLLARYGNDPEQNISYPVYEGNTAATSIWAQVAAAMANIPIDVSYFDNVSAAIPGTLLLYKHMKIVGDTCVAANSKLHRELLAPPKVGDPVYTNSGLKRDRIIASVDAWRFNKRDGRCAYTLTDSEKRMFTGAKIIHNGDAIWAPVL